MRLGATLGGALLLLAGTAPAETPALEDITAFERGFAVSLYQFDGCGDALAGRLFRRALAERFAHCPFTAAARSRYQSRTRLEQARIRERMQRLVEETGGLPRELPGMTGTCHAQQASEPYRRFRELLDRYAEGDVPAESVIPAACDAADIMP